MKIIVDECISSSTASLLSSLGFEVITVDEILGHGAEDEKIYEYASARDVSIVTHDRRFGKLHLESQSKPTSVIVVRVISPHPKGTNEILEDALQRINVADEKYRIRETEFILSPGLGDEQTLSFWSKGSSAVLSRLSHGDSLLKRRLVYLNPRRSSELHTI